LLRDINYIEREGGGRDYALYVTEFDGTPIKTIAIPQDQLARFQWFSDTQLAVTTCPNDECELAIHELMNGDVTSIELGGFLVSSYLSSTDRFLLTSLDYSGVYFKDRRTGEDNLQRG
jgi:hypothetical protein